MPDPLERLLAGLRAALVASPDNGPLWAQVGDVLAELGRDGEAWQAYTEAELLLDGQEQDRVRALLCALHPPDPGTPPLRASRRTAEAQVDPALNASPPPTKGSETRARARRIGLRLIDGGRADTGKDSDAATPAVSPSPSSPSSPSPSSSPSTSPSPSPKA